MSAAALQLVLPTRLPLEPCTLVDLEPIERGQLYNTFDLDSCQRGAVEEAIRAVEAGVYADDAAQPQAGVAEHLAREREQREALRRPGREGGGS